MHAESTFTVEQILAIDASIWIIQFINVGMAFGLYVH
jgi:hypothetical protein